MGKICDWYKQDICDCFCDGLNINCKNYSGDLCVNTENDLLEDLLMEQKEQM